MMILLMVTSFALLTSMGLLMCHPPTWRSTYAPLFKPGPQFCPDTGRTVCAAVDYYPTERIYNLLRSARSQVFNLTSLFVDERKGDTEPNLSQLIIHPPYYQDRNSYGEQPPPGGRFSPAGRPDSSTFERTPPNDDDGGDSPPSNQQNRWRQVPPSTRITNNNGGGYEGSYGSPPQDSHGSDEISPQRQRTNSRQIDRGIPMARSNDNIVPNQGNIPPNQGNIPPNQGNIPRGNVIPPHVQQQKMPDEKINYGPSSVWGAPHHQTGSFTMVRNEQGQNFQRVPAAAVAPNNNKGNAIFNRNTEIPEMDYTWNGPPEDQISYSQERYGDNGNQRGSDPKYSNSVKRGKRNQDVEVACPVQSTFVPPRAALNDQSEWKYIVNIPERDQRFSQVVRVDVCLTEGEACSSRLSLPFGFESRCRQKYIKKKLLSLNSDGQGTGEDNFFIPSCCVCEIVRSSKK